MQQKSNKQDTELTFPFLIIEKNVNIAGLSRGRFTKRVSLTNGHPIPMRTRTDRRIQKTPLQIFTDSYTVIMAYNYFNESI